MTTMPLGHVLWMCIVAMIAMPQVHDVLWTCIVSMTTMPHGHDVCNEPATFGSRKKGD